MQRSAFCRSRREFSNAYFVAKFGFDTAVNEPFQHLVSLSFSVKPAMYECTAPAAGRRSELLGTAGLADTVRCTEWRVPRKNEDEVLVNLVKRDLLQSG